MQPRATRLHVPQLFLVADPSGAIVLETAGREWATEPVDGPGRSISNGLTIPAFAAAHADRLRGRVAACDLRRARTQAAAAGARGPSDLMAALRDHGAGRPGPVWSRVNGSLERPVRARRRPGHQHPDHVVVGGRPAGPTAPLGDGDVGTVHVAVQAGPGRRAARS